MQARLLRQLELTAVKEEEHIRNNRHLAQHAMDRDALIERLSKSREQAEKLETLKNERNKVIEETKEVYYAHVKEDEKLRKELSDTLAEKIAGLNERMQTDVGARGNALEENARLKEQIKILEENTVTTPEKFQELCATRDKESAGIQERLAKEMETEKVLLEKIVEQKKLLPAAKAAYEEVKEMVDAYVAKFSKIQANLVEANKTYTKSREEQERMVKKIQITEKEAVEAAKRAERSKLEHDQESMAMQRFENQLRGLEEQTFKLKTTTATLLGKPTTGTHVDPTTK